MVFKQMTTQQSSPFLLQSGLAALMSWMAELTPEQSFLTESLILAPREDNNEFAIEDMLDFE